jgi:hypothetical protein
MNNKGRMTISDPGHCCSPMVSVDNYLYRCNFSPRLNEKEFSNLFRSVLCDT